MVVLVHYLLYKKFEKRIKLSKQCIMNLTGVLSVLLWVIGSFIVDVLPKSLRGSYDSMWGDLTIFPMLIIVLHSLIFMLIYVLVINLILLYKKHKMYPQKDRKED
ncbi:hypothetical protein IGJ55_000145 [Enterococcus sp. AZ170]